METTFDVAHKGEAAWAYRLDNTVTGKWYIGISKSDIDDYDTSSEDIELLSAISRGEVVRRIIRFDESYPAMEIWETQELTFLNAKDDPMSYNHSNGMARIKRLPRIEMMKGIADEIRKTNSYNNINPTVVDLTDEKDFKRKRGYLKPTSKLNDVIALQPRDKKIDHDHLMALVEKIDQNRGNLASIEATTGQKLLCVFLTNRLWKGRKVELRIDGNHTMGATILANYGFNLRILYIPESMHNDWTDDEIRLLGEYLNPRSEITALQTSEDDIIKTCVVLALQYGRDSGVINDHLNEHKLTNKAKARIKKNVATKLNNLEEEDRRPQNFIDYADSKEPLKLIVEEHKKKPNTWSVYWSTSKASIGDYATKILKRIYHGKENLKVVHIVLYHPTIVAKKKFDKEYAQGFEDWKRILKYEGVELRWTIMPWLKDEGET